MTKNKTLLLLASFALVATAACSPAPVIEGISPDASPIPPDEEDKPPGADPGSAGEASAGEGNTFDHPGGPDIWEFLQRLAEEGPANFSSRLHSCPKMKYQTIGRLLQSRGVNLAAGNDTQAGFLWTNGSAALGAAKLDVRSRESTQITTAAAGRLFDIFVQAAPEIIAAMPTLTACTIDGVGTSMFDVAGSCTADGIACLTGLPATELMIEVCNTMVTQASTPVVGQQLAVAALAASAHTCE